MTPHQKYLIGLAPFKVSVCIFIDGWDWVAGRNTRSLHENIFYPTGKVELMATLNMLEQLYGDCEYVKIKINIMSKANYQHER